LKYDSLCKKKNDIGGKGRMIKLIEKQKIIIAYFREGKSQRQIARQMGLNRRTITKYIKDYETKKAQLTGPLQCRAFW
jgi:DNA-binding CsgD family transcriptional regulator